MEQGKGERPSGWQRSAIPAPPLALGEFTGARRCSVDDPTETTGHGTHSSSRPCLAPAPSQVILPARHLGPQVLVSPSPSRLLVSSFPPILFSTPLSCRPMCKSRGDARASEPRQRPSPRATQRSTISGDGTSSRPADRSASTNFSSTSSASSRVSLASLRDSLSDNPTLYPISEIAAVTNNFLSKRVSSSSSVWRCQLRGRDVVVVQRAIRGDPDAVPARLTAVCRSHHAAIVPLLGAALSAPHLYLAYAYAPGATLAHCLRNPKNPSFTPLSTWLSRVSVAVDLAEGLDYIHNHAVSGASGRPRGTVHNRLTSSSVIVSEPLQLRARLCYFAAAYLAGEIPPDEDEDEDKNPSRRNGGRREARVEGKRGYMAPEVAGGARPSRRSDVFAFGVVLLELLSGDQPIRVMYDPAHGDYVRSSLIETAREAVKAAAAEESSTAAEDRRGRVRRWLDGRLRDSYPVEVAEGLVRLALRCVDAAAAARPDMTWVAANIKMAWDDSEAWAQRVRPPTDFSVSLAPR